MQHPDNDSEDNNALMLKCHNRLISSYSRWASGLTAQSAIGGIGGGANNQNNNNAAQNGSRPSSANASLQNPTEERKERILPANFTEILATVNSHVAKNRKAFIDAERRKGDLTYLYVAQIDNGDEEKPANIQQKVTYSYVAQFDTYDEASVTPVNQNSNTPSTRSHSNSLPKLASSNPSIQTNGTPK